MHTLQRILGVNLVLGENASIDDYIMRPETAMSILQNVSERFGRISEATHGSGDHRQGEHTIMKYRGLMTRGEFSVTTIQFAYVSSEPDTIYLTNGRHRMSALCRAPDDVAVKFIIQVRAVDTIEEVIELIRSHDTGKSRSKSDIDLISEFHREIGIPKHDVPRFNSAVDMILLGLNPNTTTMRSLSIRTCESAKRDWAPYLLEFDSLINNGTVTDPGPFLKKVRLRTRNSAITAIGMITLRCCPKLARPYWGLLGDTQNLEDTSDPVVTYAQFLRDAPAAPRLAYTHCNARYWEAWVMEKSLTSSISVSMTARSLDKEPRPVKLACTPYRGDAQIHYAPPPTGAQDFLGLAPEGHEFKGRFGERCRVVSAKEFDALRETNDQQARVKRRLASLASHPRLQILTNME